MDPNTKLAKALQPTRSLKTFTLLATVPIILMSAALLFTSNQSLITLSVVCAIISITGFVWLLYETMLDIAGYPEYHLPIWSVFYLIAYLISAFTFLIFGMRISGPNENPVTKEAFIDALYTSMAAYIGHPTSLETKETKEIKDIKETKDIKDSRFIPVIEGALSMFLNIVIITKFVSAF